MGSTGNILREINKKETKGQILKIEQQIGREKFRVSLKHLHLQISTLLNAR